MIHRKRPCSLVSQNPALQVRDSGRGDWTGRSPTKNEDNGDPSFLQPRKLYQFTPPTQEPILGILYTDSTTFQTATKKKRKCRDLVSGKIATLSITATPLTIIPTPLIIIPTRSTIPSIIPSTILLLMRGIRFSHGYLHWNPEYGTMILEPTESNMWETGSYGQRNIRIGAMAFTVANPISRPCLVTEIRGSARPTLGKKPYPP